MALDASQVLGSPQIAGVKVNPSGMAKRVGVAIAGTLPARIVHGPSGQTTSNAPKFGRLAYLAVTADELALVKLKSGLVTLKLEEVLARVPRSEVASAELGSGLAPPLAITFGSGESWQLEIPPPNRKHAQAVVDTLRPSA
jgi:hypothetical protein